MNLIPKTYISILLFFFLALFSVSLLSVGVISVAAINFKSQVITEIEESDFNAEVITACEQAAADNGFTLTVEGPYVLNQDFNKKVAYVRVDYPYTLRMLGINETHSISGIAR